MSRDAFFIVLFFVLVGLALTADRLPTPRRATTVAGGLFAVAAALAALEVGGWTGWILIIGAVVLVDAWRLLRKGARARV